MRHAGTGSVPMIYYYDTLRTPFGWCAVVSGPSGPRRVFLAEPRLQSLLAAVFSGFPGCRFDAATCRETVAFLERYFTRGAAAEPPAALDPGPATPFQRAVWDAADAIAFGQVRTYGWIADRIGCPSAARAVGSALGANPLPIIVPCHRVVCGNGSLGGFSAPGGVVLKRRLLEHEGHVFDEHGRLLDRER